MLTNRPHISLSTCPPARFSARGVVNNPRYVMEGTFIVEFRASPWEREQALCKEPGFSVVELGAVDGARLHVRPVYVGCVCMWGRCV